DRRIREELHPGKQGWRTDADLPSSSECGTPDRTGRFETACDDALDRQEQAGRSNEELIFVPSWASSACACKHMPRSVENPRICVAFLLTSRALDRQEQIGRSNEELIFFEEISGIIRH